MGCLQPWYKNSPSSANLFREAQDAFLYRYGFGKRDDEEPPKAAIGKAVEKVVYMLLLHPDMGAQEAAAIAFSEYDELTGGLLVPEREDIPAIATRAWEALLPYGIPLTYQHKLSLPAGERYGLKFPVVGYTDFGYEDVTVDLKVTWAAPSKPKFSHVCAAGVYSELQGGRAQTLCYITPKKAVLHHLDPDSLKIGWRTALACWRKIEALDTRYATPEEAAKEIMLNTDSFRWSGVKPEQREELMSTFNV